MNVSIFEAQFGPSDRIGIAGSVNIAGPWTVLCQWAPYSSVSFQRACDTTPAVKAVASIDGESNVRDDIIVSAHVLTSSSRPHAKAVRAKASAMIGSFPAISQALIRLRNARSLSLAFRAS